MRLSYAWNDVMLVCKEIVASVASSIKYLALFPGLPTVQFLITWSMQKRRGEAWYHLSCE